MSRPRSPQRRVCPSMGDMSLDRKGARPCLEQTQVRKDDLRLGTARCGLMFSRATRKISQKNEPNSSQHRLGLICKPCHVNQVLV